MQFINLTTLFIAAASILSSCQPKGNQNNNSEAERDNTAILEKNKEARDDSLKLTEAYALQAQFSNIVSADYETTPVKSNLGDDAADDPAIWINKIHPEKSMIIGTNKKAGLNVYDLQGNELQFIPIGKMNNADVSYNFAYKGQQVDLLAGSNRTSQSIDVLLIDGANQKIIEKPLCSIPSSVDDVYGLCMYFDAVANKHYVFVNGKNGKIEQWLLKNDNDSIKGELARSFWVSSQPEGMVVDHVTNTLFVGVEEDAIYKFKAQAQADTSSIRLTASCNANNAHISYDIEGLTIYRISDTKGYLLASIQGNFSYAIFDLSEKNNYITSFIIKDGVFDGVEETDGIDANASLMGPKFPKGMLVVQDGFNKDKKENQNQNFKIISFERILQFLQ
ncbi:phytase [Saccharicrinis fermentans]|uniref:3-phytase n=1 Tax=Saccharicrinis fermentans DSM 9555 = JCM 21142 TaxID=869213 RepID=W7Y8Q2_9BACT|nr:phytase [Saccharicrinis fermentans]GAF04607.1 3-phytase precursor [Saccharicrinis fermentans DSM 9555 = JCM 21142]